jgi:hypothetical protein
VEQHAMSASVAGICRKTSCANLIPPSLADEQICLDHFLDEAFRRADDVMDRCQKGHAIDPLILERLLSDALAIVTNLEEGAAEEGAGSRERMLELLLSLANLHEYAAHHSISLGPPS